MADTSQLIKEQNQAYAEALAADRAKELEEQLANTIVIPDVCEDDDDLEYAPIDDMDEEAQLAAAIAQSKSEARLNGTLLPRDDQSFARSWEERWKEMRSLPLQKG